MLLFSIIFFALWLFFHYKIKSVNKKGIKVYATITNVTEEEERDKNNYFINKYYWYECEFDYNGIQKKKVSIPGEFGDKLKKIGDKVECLYISKDDIVMFKETQDYNNKGYYHIFLIIALLPLMFFIIKLLLNLISNQLNIDLFVILFILFGYVLAIFIIIIGFICYKKSNISDEYIKINAIVKDIFVDYSDDSITYGPILEFYYNGENIIKKSSFSSNHNKYKIGDNIIIYYNFKNGKCETNASFKFLKLFGIVFMISGVLFILSSLFLQ